MITIGIKNAPEEAKYWVPLFFDEVGHIVASAREFLPIWTAWGTSLIGPSSGVELEIELYATDQYPYQPLDINRTGFIDWLDSTNYAWNYETKELEIVNGEAPAAKKLLPLLLIGAGVLTVGVVLVKRK